MAWIVKVQTVSNLNTTVVNAFMYPKNMHVLLYCLKLIIT